VGPVASQQLAARGVGSSVFSFLDFENTRATSDGRYDPQPFPYVAELRTAMTDSVAAAAVTTSTTTCWWEWVLGPSELLPARWCLRLHGHATVTSWNRLAAFAHRHV